MKGKILSQKEKRELLKGELVKARERASKSSDYITNALEKLGVLNKERAQLGNKLLYRDINIENNSVIIAYVGSTSVIALSISSLLTLIFKVDFMSALFMNGIFCFSGMSVGFILVADKALENREVNFLSHIAKSADETIQNLYYKYLLH